VTCVVTERAAVCATRSDRETHLAPSWQNCRSAVRLAGLQATRV